jgi:TRAP-type C4-dicarboxylate transport system permease small subunit
MRTALRAVALLLIFAGVAWFSAHEVRVRAAAGTPAAQVQLSAAMAGLFAGGAAAVIAAIAMIWKRR